MRGEGAGGTHGGDNRCRRHILGKHWRKCHSKPGVGNRSRGTFSRGQGETSGAGERVFGDSGMETVAAQVGG